MPNNVNRQKQVKLSMPNEREVTASRLGQIGSMCGGSRANLSSRKVRLTILLLVFVKPCSRLSPRCSINTKQRSASCASHSLVFVVAVVKNWIE